MTFEEMERLLIQEHGDGFTNHMDAYKEILLADRTLDTRMFSERVVAEAWKWIKDKSPAIILFYSSLYSPRIGLNGKTDKERRLIQALYMAVEAIQPHYPYPIVTKDFFPYISDMSFVAPLKIFFMK